jgi:murein L,D-transpeptidase YcbB/YkuD
MALANYVLGAGQQRSAQVLLEELVAQKKTRTIPLPEPVPVYLWYQTAWMDESGSLQFRNDIYGHDRRLAAALRRELAPEKGDSYAGNLSVEAVLGLLQ